MRKKYVKTFSALLLALCMMAQPCLSYAAETSAQQPQAAEQEEPEEQTAVPPAAETPAAEAPAVETPAAETPDTETPAAETPVPEETAPVPEETVTERTVELAESLAAYLQKQEDAASYADTVSLEVKTSGGYLLTREDLAVMIQTFPALTKLDVRQSMFDSEETLAAFQEHFAAAGTVEFLYTEGAFPAEEAPQEDAALDEEESSSGLELQDAGYTLQLNGICLVNRGVKYEVGVAYESTDPNVEFQWKQYDLSTGVWTIVDDWRTGNWITWEPEREGDYWIYVEARTSDGKTASSVYGTHYEGIQVQLNGICVLDKQDHYEMGVAYTSNDPDLKFQWMIYDLQAQTWTIIQEPIAGNWTSWSPKKAGNYWLHVEAIDSKGGVTAQTIGFYYPGLQLQLNGICVIDQASQVDMGVAYTTNDADVQFRWKLYDLSTGVWTVIADWNAGNWASWKPEKSGDYWLYVEAMTSDGQVKTQVYGHHVSGAKITSFSASPQSPAWTDSTITLKGTYQDLIGEVGMSRFLVYNGSVWTEISANEGSAEWTPGQLGSYLLCYEIYNRDGGLIEQSFTGYSIEEPYMNISGIYVRKDGTMKYSMAASVSTNDRAAQYRWLYYDPAAGIWHEISGWSNSTATTWNAPKEGYYWLYVEAKIHGDITKSYTMGYTVNRYPADLESMMYLANAYSSSTPYIIMVNCNTHKVGIFQGWTGNWSPVYYWDCTTGAPGTPTVKGTFRVGSKGYYFDSGSSRCYWYTQFYGNYLFHSVLYSKYNGSLVDGRLGMSLSHGCVRLDINNAKWIYDNIPTGTTVVVY